jgi:hypothetical protein
MLRKTESVDEEGFTINRIWSVVLLLLIAFVVECTIAKNVTGEPLPGNELTFVTVRYNLGRDILLEGLNAKTYELYFENSSSSDLENCILTIDDEYKAQLSDIEYYYGFSTGFRPYGSNTLPARTTLEFDFCHDNNNYRVFRNESEERLPHTIVIRKIRIECTTGVGEWEFEPRN